MLTSAFEDLLWSGDFSGVFVGDVPVDCSGDLFFFFMVDVLVGLAYLLVVALLYIKEEEVCPF